MTGRKITMTPYSFFLNALLVAALILVLFSAQSFVNYLRDSGFISGDEEAIDPFKSYKDKENEQ